MSFQIGVNQIPVSIRDRDVWKQSQKLSDIMQTLMPSKAK